MNSDKLYIRRIFVAATIISLVLVIVGLGSVSQARARVYWQQKVDPWVLEEAGKHGKAEFLIVLSQQADLSEVADIRGKEQKGAYVYEQLTSVALHTQPTLITELQRADSDFRQFWVSNMIWVRSDASVVETMAKRSEVAHIYANPWVKLDVIGPLLSLQVEDTAETVEQNIVLVKAPDVWNLGIYGQGAVIGGQDTGYDWQHPALINQYRGWNGGMADHNYNWHDAIHEDNPNTSPDNPCGFDLPEPCDDHGHGTHTMGTMVGDDGGANQIGMAPKADWVACRNMEQGWGTPTTYAECYEWFIAPYPIGGDKMLDGDPSKAPHVINNSWSCPAVEGCTDPDILRQVVDNVRAAGILTAHSASNAGSACSSIASPAAIYDASFTVGATDNGDNIASFSARGPVTVGDNNPAKPDISAPGVSIRSSWLDNNYSWLSGTSMASPHVAGLAGLLVSANPLLAGDVDGLEQIIKETAVPLTTNEGCGGDSVDAVPNHVYGWGRIDALTAYNDAVQSLYQFFAPVSFSK